MRRYAWVGQARLTAIFRLDTQRDGHALAQRVIANHVQWHLSFPPGIGNALRTCLYLGPSRFRSPASNWLRFAAGSRQSGQVGFCDTRKTLNAHSRQKLWWHEDVVALGQKTGSHRRLRQIVQVSSSGMDGSIYSARLGAAAERLLCKFCCAEQHESCCRRLSAEWARRASVIAAEVTGPSQGFFVALLRGNGARKCGRRHVG